MVLYGDRYVDALLEQSISCYSGMTGHLLDQLRSDLQQASVFLICLFGYMLLDFSYVFLDFLQATTDTKHNHTNTQ